MSADRTVYLVVSENPYGGGIRGVFSTRALADAYAARRAEETNWETDAIVTEVTVDTPAEFCDDESEDGKSSGDEGGHSPPPGARAALADEVD